MAVILANTRMGIARKPLPMARDEWGMPVAAREETPRTQLLPASCDERADSRAEQGREWSIRLDDSLWPVEVGDHIVEDGPRVWVVTAAKMGRNVADSALDYVAVTAVLEVPEVPS